MRRQPEKLRRNVSIVRKKIQRLSQRMTQKFVTGITVMTTVKMVKIVVRRHVEDFQILHREKGEKIIFVSVLIP